MSIRRRLIVMRHAKSDWNTDALTDHERPLNKRGRRDAPRIGSHIAELAWTPDHVLCSDATRTRQTWELMASAFDVQPPALEFRPELYAAGPRAALTALAEVPDSAGTAMLIGHNPGWEELVSRLSGQWCRMTTANAAMLEIDAETWATAAAVENDWKLVRVLRPKELPTAGTGR